MIFNFDEAAAKHYMPCFSFETLKFYAEGAGSDTERSCIDRHVNNCDDCSGLLNQLKTAPDEFNKRLADAIAFDSYSSRRIYSLAKENGAAAKAGEIWLLQNPDKFKTLAAGVNHVLIIEKKGEKIQAVPINFSINAVCENEMFIPANASGESNAFGETYSLMLCSSFEISPKQLYCRKGALKNWEFEHVSNKLKFSTPLNTIILHVDPADYEGLDHAEKTVNEYETKKMLVLPTFFSWVARDEKTIEEKHLMCEYSNIVYEAEAAAIVKDSVKEVLRSYVKTISDIRKKASEFAEEKFEEIFIKPFLKPAFSISYDSGDLRTDCYAAVKTVNDETPAVYETSSLKLTQVLLNDDIYFILESKDEKLKLDQSTVIVGTSIENSVEPVEISPLFCDNYFMVISLKQHVFNKPDILRVRLYWIVKEVDAIVYDVSVKETKK